MNEPNPAAKCWQSAFCRAFDHKPGCPYYAIGRGVDEHMHPDPQGAPNSPGVSEQDDCEIVTHLRIAYADPPYPGQSHKHYRDHPDFAGEVDHLRLCHQLADYDGWVLHTSSVALASVLACVAAAELTDWRVMAWVKPFAAFKANVPVAYAWEPVIVKAARKPVVSGRMVMRDWLAESITMQRGLTGAKPERVCHWLFECVGAEPDDEMADLFPGTNAVSRAWTTWGQQLRDTPSPREEGKQ